MLMNALWNDLGLLLLAFISLYIIALGFGVVIAQGRGVAYVNKMARRVAAWPIGLLGKAIIALADAIHG